MADSAHRTLSTLRVDLSTSSAYTLSIGSPTPSLPSLPPSLPPSLSPSPLPAHLIHHIESQIPDEDSVVAVSAERLRELEALEKRLPSMIEKAIQDHKKEKLKLLHQRDKLDPSLVNIRVKRYAMKHKDEINAKRREKRKQAAKGLTQTPLVVHQDSTTTAGVEHVSADTYRRTTSTLTVSFDD